MSKIQEFRQKYPKYNYLSDTELADKFHDKYYSGKISKEEFYNKLGVKPEPKQQGYLKNAADYFGGGIVGHGQGLGDFLASVGNLGVTGAEKLSGANIPHIPHPNLRQYYPESEAGQLGGKLGELGSGFAIPGLGGAGAVGKIASKIPEKVVENIPKYAKTIAKYSAPVAGGAAAGYAGNEEDRGMGALYGTAGGAIPELFKAGKSGWNMYREPHRQLREVEKNILEHNKQIHGHVNREHEEFLGAEERSKEQINKLFPNKPASELDVQQVKAITQGKKDIKNQFDIRYKE